MVSILCTSRSGSTNLSLYLKEVFGIKFISSPFFKKNTKISSLKKNYLYKHMIHRLPEGYDDMYQFGKDVIELSDKIILFDRKDKVKQSESLAFRKLKYENDYSKYHIREPYVGIDDKNVEECLFYFNNHSNIIQMLSKEFNIPIFYYEDVYYGNGLEELSKYLNIEIDKKTKSKYLLEDKKERLDNLKGDLI